MKLRFDVLILRNKAFLIILVIFLSLSNNAFADKIHLKSGQVKEGMLKVRKARISGDNWCTGEDEIEFVWSSLNSECLAKSDIVKVEKEFKEPKGIALLAKDDLWGDELNGYRTQLIPASSEYMVGYPMFFHLVMKNVSIDTKWYDSQGLGHDDLIIKDANGEKVYYKGMPFQTGGSGKPIDPEEIVTLFENRNIAAVYSIMEPGKYAIQFRKGNYGMSEDSTFPASNILEFEVKSGIPGEHDILISALSDILPDGGWQLLPSQKMPPGVNPAKCVSIFIERQSKSKDDIVAIALWQTNEPSDALAQQKVGGSEVIEYLGHSSSGKHYYAYIPLRAEEYWPSVRNDIVKALDLQK